MRRFLACLAVGRQLLPKSLKGRFARDQGRTAESYKKECQEKTFPFGSMPIDFLSWHSAQLPERALLS